MTSKQKVSLLSFGFWKVLLFLVLFSLIISFLFGIGFLFLLEETLKAFEIRAVPLFGRIVLALIVFPLISGLVSALFWTIILLIAKIILKLIRGINLFFQDEEILIKKDSREEPYKLLEES